MNKRLKCRREEEDEEGKGNRIDLFLGFDPRKIIPVFTSNASYCGGAGQSADLLTTLDRLV